MIDGLLSINDIDKINQPEFIRCHRSYIINTNKVSTFASQKLWIDNVEIPVSAKYKERLSEILNN